MNCQSLSNRHIARHLNFSYATISKEINRGDAIQVKLVNRKKIHTQTYVAETGQSFTTNNLKAARKLYMIYQLGHSQHKIKEDHCSPETSKKLVRADKKVLGTSIAERPESNNERSEFGHLEVDTVIGSNATTFNAP